METVSHTLALLLFSGATVFVFIDFIALKLAGHGD